MVSDISRRRKKGKIDTMMLVVVGLIIFGFVLAATASVTNSGVSGNIGALVQKSAKEIASGVSALSAVDQGVRFYGVRETFLVGLQKEHVSVSYDGGSGNSFIHTFPHTVNNESVIPASVTGKKKICISKKLDGCKPEVTICGYPDGACCTVQKSTCVYVG